MVSLFLTRSDTILAIIRGRVRLDAETGGQESMKAEAVASKTLHRTAGTVFSIRRALFFIVPLKPLHIPGVPRLNVSPVTSTVRISNH